MRILSRMLAFAFDRLESVQEVRSVECAQCFKEPHAILQPWEGTEHEMYEWMQAHTNEKGHTEFRTYTVQVGRARTSLVQSDE